MAFAADFSFGGIDVQGMVVSPERNSSRARGAIGSGPGRERLARTGVADDRGDRAVVMVAPRDHDTELPSSVTRYPADLVDRAIVQME